MLIIDIIYLLITVITFIKAFISFNILFANWIIY